MFLHFMPSREIERLVEWDYYPEIRNDERRHVMPQLAERLDSRLDSLGVATDGPCRTTVACPHPAAGYVHKVRRVSSAELVI